MSPSSPKRESVEGSPFECAENFRRGPFNNLSLNCQDAPTFGRLDTQALKKPCRDPRVRRARIRLIGVSLVWATLASPQPPSFVSNGNCCRSVRSPQDFKERFESDVLGTCGSRLSESRGQRRRKVARIPAP